MLQREFKGKVVHRYVCTNLEGRGGGTTALRGVLLSIAKNITCEI